ncbi:MAG TPA: insulinase family protein, partial [Gaiellaceae bacterium]|nr:insulinase family protein [Gaiellaceae bacterium]
DRLLTLVERMAAKAADPPARRPPARAPLVAPPPPSLVFRQRETEQYHVCLAAPGIARSDRRRFTASVLDGVLGGSASSRLFQEIREKRGLAYSVYTFSSQYADTGQIGIYVGTREENLAECLAIAAGQIRDVAAEGPRPEELERAKENLKGRIMLALEVTSNRMSRLGKSLITDSELLSLDRLLAEIEAVDATGVAQLAEVLLGLDRFSVAAIGPDEERLLAAVEPVCPGLVERAAA